MGFSPADFYRMTPKEFHLAVRGQQRFHGIDPDAGDAPKAKPDAWRIPNDELKKMMNNARVS